MERLQKVIANMGYTSRRKAEELIKDKKVKVNGKIIDTLGYKVEESDKIEVEGILLEKERKVYYLLNKPRGVITSSKDEKSRKTVVDLIDTDIRIYPVGRLDYDTTGAIILTNDGDLTNYLTHPKNEIEKVYVAKINGLLTGNDLRRLKNGIEIDNYVTSPAKVKVKKIDKDRTSSIVQITIHEGKNHEIKKMFEALGHEVLKLKRERIAFLTVDDLKSGEYRILSHNEIKKLYNYNQNKNRQ
jgi:23S rRNA pseudouridine2605 synthase